MNYFYSIGQNRYAKFIILTFFAILICSSLFLVIFFPISETSIQNIDIQSKSKSSHVAKVSDVPRFSVARIDDRQISRSEDSGLQKRMSEGSEKSQIIEKIREASSTYDPVSLPIIEPYLYSPDPEIRIEAVNSIVNLGDKSGATILRKFAEKESNLERKLEILKLAEWLELPSGNARVDSK